MNARGGSGRYAFEVDGLPAGLRSQGAVIAGIPRTTGTFPVTIRGYDDQGNTDVRTVTLTVNGATVTGTLATSGATAGTWTQVVGGSTVTATSAGAAPAAAAPRVDIGPVPVAYSPSYPTGGNNPFPSTSFPTGSSPNFIPSSLPTQIQNYNYETVTTRDFYQSTTDDIQSNAVVQRQINANKVIANLLSIIQQLTANVNGVQADIPAATAAVNQALADQRVVQQKIVAAENANKTLASNIDSVRNQITTLQTSLSKVNGDVAAAQGPIDAAFTLKSTSQAALDSAKARATGFPGALDAANQAKRDTQKSIDDLRDKVYALNLQINNIQTEISNAPSYITTADSDIANLDTQISALLAQLDKLRQQRADAKNRSDYYKNINVTGGAQIRLLKSQVDTFTSQINSLQSTLDTTNANIDKINRDSQETSTNIANLNAKIREADAALTNAQRNKDALAGQSASIVTSITATTTTLNNLLSQVPAYNNALVQAYNEGNDANDRLTHLRGVLDALRNKYTDSLAQLNDAKAALERARAEKEVADIAFNEQIKRKGGVTVLPFSIPGTGDFGIGTGGKVTASTSTASGSNAGAPLRPGALTGAGGQVGPNAQGAGAAPGALVGDLTNYVSNSLSSGVNAATLYPFIIRWGTGLRGAVLGDFTCGTSQSTGSGVITAVQDGTITIRNSNGEETVLYLGGCTKLSATRPNYQIAVGDRITYQEANSAPVVQSSKRVVNVSAVTCQA